jgi:hypothetical protein
MSSHWDADHHTIMAQAFAAIGAIVFPTLETGDNLPSFEHHSFGELGQVDHVLGKGGFPLLFFGLSLAVISFCLGTAMTNLPLAPVAAWKQFFSFRFSHDNV